MITYSIIQKSQIKSVHRIDAEYFQPKYLELEKKIYSTNSYRLWGNIEGRFITGPFGSEFGVENYTSETQYRYVRGKDVKEFFLLDDDNVYIPEKDYERLKKYSLKGSDILVSVVGTLGNAAIVDSSIVPAIFSCKSTVFRSDSINPYYFIAYINSKYGSKLLERSVRGAVQTGLNIDDLKSLPVFIPPQRERESIASSVLNAKQEYDKSKSLYSQAEDLLLEDLGLRDFKPKEELSYIVNLSGIKSANRADAEYFQPKYERLRDKIKSQISKLLAIAPLSELFSIRRGDFISPDYYSEKARRTYIRIKELPMKGDINFDAVTFVDDNFPGVNLGELLEGDFVFAGIGATLGKTARVPKELEESFYSNNTARFRLKKNWKDKVETYYLQAVFQSVVCQMQFEQRQAPTAQAKIADEELKTVLIPILRKPNQEKIADLVRRSHTARKKAKELLGKAKKEVEEFIEKK